MSSEIVPGWRNIFARNNQNHRPSASLPQKRMDAVEIVLPRDGKSTRHLFCDIYSKVGPSKKLSMLMVAGDVQFDKKKGARSILGSIVETKWPKYIIETSSLFSPTCKNNQFMFQQGQKYFRFEIFSCINLDVSVNDFMQ